MFGLDVGLRAHEDLVPNEFQSTDWPALRSGVGTTSWTGDPGFMGLVHSKPLPPATEGGDVYYLTVSFPRFAFADRPGGRGRPRISHQCDRGYAPQFVKETHEYSGSVGSPKR
jgi:hypothetical protein